MKILFVFINASIPCSFVKVLWCSKEGVWWEANPLDEKGRLVCLIFRNQNLYCMMYLELKLADLASCS